jgi:hypothetical protein
MLMPGLRITVQSVLEKEVTQKCNACLFFTDCAYRLKSEKFILQCEAFVDVADDTAWKQPSVIAELKGLCTNCSRLPHCKLPKSPTGVWHCEEYE